MNEAERADVSGTVQQLAARVGTMESELAALRQELDRTRTKRSATPPSGPSAEALRMQSRAWDEVLGLTPEARERRAAAQQRPTVEDICLRFVTQHSGKIWLLLLLFAGITVAMRDRLV